MSTIQHETVLNLLPNDTETQNILGVQRIFSPFQEDNIIAMIKSITVV